MGYGVRGMGKKVNESGSPPGSGECIKLPSWEGAEREEIAQWAILARSQTAGKVLWWSGGWV